LLEKTIESLSLSHVFGKSPSRKNKFVGLDPERHYSAIKRVLKEVYAPFYSLISKPHVIKDLEKRFKEASREHGKEIEERLGKKNIGLKVTSPARRQKNLEIYVQKILEEGTHLEQLKSLEPFLEKSSELLKRYSPLEMEVVAPHDSYLGNLTLDTMLDMGNVGKLSKAQHLACLLCDPLIFEKLGKESGEPSLDQLEQKEFRIKQLLHDLNMNITYSGQKFDVDATAKAVFGWGVYTNLRLSAGYIRQGGNTNMVNRLLDTSIDLVNLLKHRGEI